MKPLVISIYTKDGEVQYATTDGHVMIARVPVADLPKPPPQETKVEEGKGQRTLILTWAGGWSETIGIIYPA